MFSWSQKKRIYLDYASATPVRKEVLSVMMSYFTQQFGNAGAIHKEGVEAMHAIEDARRTLARVLRIVPEGIVFTGSGTESNNLAILGVIEEKRKAGVAYTDMEVVSTRIEHASVYEVLQHLETLGIGIVYVETDTEGIILAEAFKKSLSPKTVLCSFAYVNSEIGVVQPIGKIARIVRAYEKEHNTRICVHVDAAQAPLWLPCALDSLGCDCMTFDAGKCYGPKGVGVLAFNGSVSFSPQILGGKQERGLRAGTENTALIVGSVASLSLAQEHYLIRSDEVQRLRDSCIEALEKIEGVVVNGSKELRVANNVNISIDGVESEFAVVTLDEQGIAVATKSACGGAKGDGSSVVRTITGDENRSRSTIRFTLGEETTQEEINYTVEKLKEHIDAVRTANARLARA